MQSDLHLGLLGKGPWEAKGEKELREASVTPVTTENRLLQTSWLLLRQVTSPLQASHLLGICQWLSRFYTGSRRAFPFQLWLQKLPECELTAQPGITARSRYCPAEPIKWRRRDCSFPHTACCAPQPDASSNTILCLFLLGEGKSPLPAPGSSILRTGR